MNGKTMKVSVVCPYCNAMQLPSFYVDLAGLFLHEKMVCVNPHCKKEFYIFEITVSSKTKEELIQKREEAIKMLKALADAEKARAEGQIQ